MTQLNSTSTVRALLLPLLLGTLTAHAAASDLHVDDDGMDYPNAGYTSLQAAVDAAKHWDTIHVHAGTYTGTGSEVVYIYEKPLDLIADSTNGDVVIDGQNARRCMTVINRDAEHEFVYGDENCIHIDGFKIINGLAQSGLGINSQHGGGIYAEGRVQLWYCEVSNCRSDGNGGGIAAFNPELTSDSTDADGHDYHPYTYLKVISLTVESCVANGDGGGIWNWESEIYLGGTTSIKMNGAFGRGGGVATHHWYAADAYTNLDWGIEVWSNTSEGDGGGVFAEGNQGHILFRDVEIVSNRALAGDGGGVCLFNARAFYGELSLVGNDTDQTVAGGSGGNGGGLAARSSSFVWSSYPGKASLVVLGNTADSSGGGIFAKDSDIDLAGAQFEENLAGGKGGGMAVISCTDFDLEEVTFLENIGRVAGGLYLKNTYGTLTDSSVLYNKGFMNGGLNGAGITIDGGSAELAISGTNFWQNTKKHIMKANGGKFTDGGGNSVQP